MASSSPNFGEVENSKKKLQETTATNLLKCFAQDPMEFFP